MKKFVKNLIKYAIIMVLILSFNSYALTINNYNRFCEDGKLMNVEIKFNDVVAKYNKYGHYQLGDDLMPTGDLSDPLSNEGDRDMAHIAVQSDTTFKIYGELDEEEMDYSFYDLEDVSASELKVYELNAKLEALHVGNQVQERSGFGKYNLRNGKNLIAFIKFAYEFYKNSSGEYRVGVKDDKLFKDTPAAGYPVCPMELLEEYAGLNSTSAVILENDFEGKFKDCISKWEYIGNKELSNSDKIFETLEDIYMGLVYLYPALKVLQSKGIVLDDLDDDDRAAIFSMAYEVKGMQPITSMDVSDEKLTKKFSKIGAGDLIGALIEDEELGFSIAETVYRYMIEIKHKNNPQNLARWVAEYEDLFGSTYEPLDADSYDRFIKAYNVAFAKYGFDVSKQTGLDYVFFGYVEHPELFESKESLEEAKRKFANHLRAYFSDSAFIRNKDNANYVAKSYMMAQKICENTGFMDITDIYASDICLVEHSYGYGDQSTEVMLSDTQVVSLECPLEDGDFDTDKDEVLDKDELGTLEEVNISRLLEAYIKYNELDQEEADKLRATPTVKMYNYISNPVLPDSDFDGRDDARDRARALENDYTFDMDTISNRQIHFDFNMDYRYFFMDSSAYYPELSDMSLALSNMIGKHKGTSYKTFKNRNSQETYEETGISKYLWYIGQDDIEERNTGVVPYAISHREVFLQRGKVNHKLRNVITIVIGEDENYKNLLSANIDGSYNEDGDYEMYHHVGFDIEANRIVEDIDEYISNQYGTKVFWITGFGSGGSIANLVAQKLTKKKGVSNVYAYTFESFATINANNIDDPNSFDYRRYINIFNVENDDDLMIKILDRDVGWYKYGRSVRGSAAQLNTKLSKILGNNFRGNSGEKSYRGSPNIVSKVINGILDSFMNIINGVTSGITNAIDGLVSGFTGTEPVVIPNLGPGSYYENPGPGVPASPTMDDRINLSPQNQIEARQGQYQVIVGQGPGSSYANVPSNATIPILDANMPEVGQLTNNDKGLFVEEQPPKPLNNVTYNANSSVSMLNAIEKVGKWYVKHVATYQRTDKRNQAIDKAKIYYKYLQDNWNSYTVRKTENGVPPSKEDNIKLDIYASPNRWMYRLSDTRQGAVPDDDQLLTYKYIKSKTYDVYYTDGTVALDNYEIEEYRKPLKSNNNMQRFGGDDCSGFMMATFEYATKALFAKKKIKGLPDREDLKYENIYTEYIFNHFTDFCNWMRDCAKIEVYTAEEVINAGGLQPGDCLLSNGERTDGNVWQGHAEFYIDDNHSFGWGDVWDLYPKSQEIKPEGTYFRFGEDRKKYQYVLRYIGE